jgi:hypothetical protein
MSPDALFNHESIQLSFNHYKAFLNSGSPSIEFTTKRGKTIVCRRDAESAVDLLDKAETLLKDMLDLKDVSTIITIKRLIELANILDTLELEDECRTVGNCALNLAQIVAGRSPSFRTDHVNTIASIAELSTYCARARTLFFQAISIQEEVVADDPTPAAQFAHLVVLGRAGYWAAYNAENADLALQWLQYGVDISQDQPMTGKCGELRVNALTLFGGTLIKQEREMEALSFQE